MIVINQSSMQWHPVAKMLLDYFGDYDETLSELSANWGTFSWSGSIIPYYEQQLALIKQLSDHPLASVRKWLAQNAEWAQQRIAFERKREEEGRLGVSLAIGERVIPHFEPSLLLRGGGEQCSPPSLRASVFARLRRGQDSAARKASTVAERLWWTGKVEG